MTIHSLRPMVRPDNQKNQVRASQSLARKLYLAALLGSVGWIAMLVFGPMVFMDADGLVVQSRETIMPAYHAKVVSVSVRPGDHVDVGERIATVISTQMLDLISDLSSREAKADARSEQISARLAAISLTLPIAERRVHEAEAAEAAVNKAMVKGYSTTPRMADMARESYDAAREVASLKAERAGLESERNAGHNNLVRLADALDRAQRLYQDGAITSPVAGTVGPRVVVPGTVLSSGDNIAEVYHGTKYVLAYLPTNRIYSTDRGQAVIVTDGMNRQLGRLQRIEKITDKLPPEFQSNFGSVERQQVARISIAAATNFPLLSKVKVTSPNTPSNLIASAGAAVKGLAISAVDRGTKMVRIALQTTVADAEPVLHRVARGAQTKIASLHTSRIEEPSIRVFGAVGREPLSHSAIQKFRWLEFCGHDGAGSVNLEGDDTRRICTVGKVDASAERARKTGPGGRIRFDWRWMTVDDSSDVSSHFQYAVSTAVLHHGARLTNLPSCRAPIWPASLSMPGG